ncbi:MAG TPA: mannose-1-phosphate guanylyltransferase [Candidatus Limnocylindria bacterium]|nr:mannose-1-phosphate guanylyltransferase [Candidatus Limnocylindria bacterium]
MYAVILAGGGGTRLWPLSRRARPKPFLPLTGEESLFQRTVTRVAPLVGEAGIYVVTDEAQLEAVRKQAPPLPDDQLLGEPFGRNTAAAVALAALAVERPGDEVMAVLPADHMVTDEDGFRRALGTAAEAAADGSFVTLGITASGPETGYGYIVGAAEDGQSAARRVARFVEKPQREQAEALLADPAGAWWNAGIFVWRRDALLDGLQRHAPDILEPLRQGLTAGTPLAEIYGDLRATSIDYALLEPASLEGRVKVLPVDVGWSDLGSWSALHAQLAEQAPTERRVVAIGRLEDLESEDVLVHSTSGRLVVTVGLRGTIIVDTPDVLLVCDVDRAQDVRRIVDQLAAAKETDHL